MADRAAGLPESVSDVEEDISESWEEIDEEVSYCIEVI